MTSQRPPAQDASRPLPWRKPLTIIVRWRCSLCGLERRAEVDGQITARSKGLVCYDLLGQVSGPPETCCRRAGWSVAGIEVRR